MPPTVNFTFERQIRKANPRTLKRVSDGDTPVIDQPIRMVSIDTPEKAQYAGKATTSQPKLDTTKERLKTGFFDALPEQLRAYLIDKLGPDAAQRHIEAGARATEEFERILEDRLWASENRKRQIAVIPTGEIIDRYGRLLAYIAPWFAGPPNDPLPDKDDPKRRTFNLEMVEIGWAAFFPIYPSIPANDDMNRAIAAAEGAWDQKRGAWKEFGDDLLLGYEYRACIKLAEPVAVARRGEEIRRYYTEEEFVDEADNLSDWNITRKSASDMIADAFSRHCVDLRDLRVAGKYGFAEVPPDYRLWVWEKDLDEARAALGLVGEV